MMAQRTKEIPEGKKKIVADLAELIKNKKTILIASIKNIPASQFQEIGKKLRGKALVRVPKKNLMLLALDSSEKEEIKKLKEQLTDSIAILFSDLDSYDLAGELLANTSPAKAKPGQEAPEDIEVEAGPTELLPGPAITELGALGIQIQIEKGKINIKTSKIIAKEGEKISSGAADVMNKLGIKPFKVGFIPISSFDNSENKLYLEIKIDREGTLEELKNQYGKSLALAVEVGYSSPDTITFMLAKAVSYEKALEKLSVEEKKEEPAKEVVEKKEEVEEKKEEIKDTPPKGTSEEKVEKNQTQEDK